MWINQIRIFKFTYKKRTVPTENEVTQSLHFVLTQFSEMHFIFTPSFSINAIAEKQILMLTFHNVTHLNT